MSDVLICFDTDGVFKQSIEHSEYIEGPIDPKRIQDLEKQGVSVAIVSPSPYYPKQPNGEHMFSTLGYWKNNSDRHRNLEAARKFYTTVNNKEPIICLYVSDNDDWQEAQKAKFVYVDVKMFANSFGGKAK